MITFSNVSLAFGGQDIFRNLTWFVRPNKRIGLIGANGAGKTTLLNVITGKYKIDDGSISIHSGLRMGYLEQEIEEALTERTVIEEAMQAFERVFLLEAEIEKVTAQMEETTDYESEAYYKILDKMEALQTELYSIEAHNIEHESATMLMGLGFTADELHRPLSEFSGGWRMRVALAKMLLRKPNLLLLDEPTNHLDIESVAWLENHLKTYDGTVILVSHDRYFLDRMVDTIAELSRGKVTEYAGNYTYYLEARIERRTLQQASYDNQQREIAEAERFIERFRAKATKAKQAQSRMKALERLERIEAPEEELSTVSFRFPTPEASGRIVLEMSEYDKSYDGGKTFVFKDAIPLKIERGDKIALVGKNGAGKSTLARMLLGAEGFQGTRTMGYKVQLTYFAQHQAETLNPKSTILEAVREIATTETETQIRSLLGAFLFTGDDVYKPIAVLSGGERSRVALARTLLKPANFLILDEPTNHLDIQSIGVLIEALKQYKGSFIVVSHDRHFLDQIVNKVWYVADHNTTEILGNYADFEWKKAQDLQKAAQQVVLASPKVESKNQEQEAQRKDQKRADADSRKELTQLLKIFKSDPTQIDWENVPPQFAEKALADTEAQIAELEIRKTELETALADPDIYLDLTKTQKLNEQYHAVQEQLAAQYDLWESVAAVG
jgi:ATP-binding cassette subfamily F protein 3